MPNLKPFIILLILFFGSCNILKNGKRVSSKKIEGTYLIKNVNIIPISKEGILNNQDVLIKNNKIVTISPSSPHALKTSSLKIIDGTGQYLMPGLGDMHVHMSDEKVVKSQLALYLMNGVTKIRSMRGKNWHLPLHKQVQNNEVLSPKLYLASNAISRRDTTYIKDIDKTVKDFKAKGFSSIKMLSVKDKATYDEYVKAARKYDLPLCGHSLRNVGIKNILEDGVYTSIEHVGGYPRALNDSEAFLDKMIDLTIEKDVYNCPTLDWSYLHTLNLEELNQRDGLAWLPEMRKLWIAKEEKEAAKVLTEDEKNYAKRVKRFFEMKKKLIKRIHEKGGKLLVSPSGDAHFSVPGFVLLAEMRQFKDLGISNAEILKMVTYNVADFYDDMTFGTVEEGKSADVILLNKNPLEDLENIHSVAGIFLNGKYHSKASLEKVAKELVKQDYKDLSKK